MTEERLEALNRIKAERYQIELVPLTAGPDVYSYATLQEAVSQGARQS
jgi:hypothetical protein